MVGWEEQVRFALPFAVDFLGESAARTRRSINKTFAINESWRSVIRRAIRGCGDTSGMPAHNTPTSPTPQACSPSSL
ncbi:hypothetical protein E2C01_099062 [Portunus trituberculatus]|uniref:Uncharacterized protein n=1 Tax=Portunus trituberculatus TaxID=210409 RepID=A0A5B7K4H2_PORTR|nr:hypothetical protein [Portunus trituberculatus]